MSSVLDKLLHWNTGTPSGIDDLAIIDDILYVRSSVLRPMKVPGEINYLVFARKNASNTFM